MSRQWRPVWVIGGLLVVLIVAGWFVRDRFQPVEVGTRAPSFVATDMEGNPVSLQSLQGEVVLLNIWATWCAPCREEMPSMERLHQELGDSGLHIVAVSVDAPQGFFDIGGNPGGDVQGFAEEMDLNFTIWRDPEGTIRRIYRTTGVPESFVIDRNGYIVTKVIGPTEWDSQANVDLIRRLLAS